MRHRIRRKSKKQPLTVTFDAEAMRSLQILHLGRHTIGDPRARLKAIQYHTPDALM